MDKKVQKLHLTNEDLSKKFRNNFELVNYAIKLAENMIRTGRDARVKSDVQNRAMLVLEEIGEGKDHFDEIVEPTTGKESYLNGEELHTEVVYENKRQDKGKAALFSMEEE